MSIPAQWTLTALAALCLLAAVSADYEPRWEDAKAARATMINKPTAPLAPALPRISVEELELPKNSKYKHREVPFILTGAMEDWPAMQKWPLDRSASSWYLGELYPREVCDFYPYNMLTQGQHPFLIRFKTGLEELLHPPGRFRDAEGKPQTCENVQGCRYIHMQLTPKTWAELEALGDIPKNRHAHLSGDEWWMRRCLQDPEVREEYHIKTHWKIILIGTKGSGMFNHSDSLMTSSWHGHFQGKKWWYVCSPVQYQGPQQCYESILEPGEVLYYGPGWFHETRNLDSPTATITGTIVTKHNYAMIADKLHSECSQGAMNFDFSAALCDSLDKCYPIWHKYLTGKEAPKGRWASWRHVSSPQNLEKKEQMLPTHNNYDGRNYITE